MADEFSIPDDIDIETLNRMLEESLAQDTALSDPEFAEADAEDSDASLNRLLAEEMQREYVAPDSGAFDDMPFASGAFDDMPFASDPFAGAGDEGESKSLADEGIPAPRFIDEDTLLDLELEEALEKDREAENSAELYERIDDFVQDLSVYTDDDILEQPVKTGRFHKINALISGISSKFLLILVAVLALLTAGAIILAVLTMIRTHALEDTRDNSGTIIRHGTAISNQAGYIYVNTKVVLPEGEAVLLKMATSREATVLYFDRGIDMSLYDAFLIDDWGRVYNLDRSYLENVAVTDETRMWFDPLPQKIDTFSLKITSLDTFISTVTKFTAGQEILHEYIRYIGQPIAVDCDSDTVSVEISNAVFSSVGSQIGYAVTSRDPREQVLLCKSDSNDVLRLTENGRLVGRDVYLFEPFTFAEDGVVIGRVDFLPVQSLDNKVQIHFNNMYKRIAVNRTVSLADIFYRNANPEMRIEVGPYELVLERAGMQINQYAIIMHTLDTRGETISDLSARVTSYLDVTMLAQLSDGSTLTLAPSVIRDADEGTDIVFDGSKERGLVGLPIERISFQIDALYAKLPPTTVEIDLAEAARKLPMAQDTALGALRTAFERRLGYKSDIFGQDGLDRFSESVLNNEALMRQYAPEKVKNPSYGVHVTTWHMGGDKLYAVLHETWRGQEETPAYFHEAHKTVSEYGDRGWIVTEDWLR